MKNGFTLIELLAVIVILAIIAIIAVPIVLNIINDAKESSLLRSAEFYLSAVEYTIADAFLYHGGLSNGKYQITPDGNICTKTLPCDDTNTLKVEVTGDKPTAGYIEVTSGAVSNILLKLSGKLVGKDELGSLELKDNVCVLTDSNKNGNFDLGEVVTCDTEKFYVIAQDTKAHKLVSNETVSLIGFYNLNVGDNKYPNETTYGIQDENAKGFDPDFLPNYGGINYGTIGYWRDEIDNFLDEYEDNTNYPFVYNEKADIIYPHLQEYKNYLIDKSVLILEATLPSVPQLVDSGCVKWSTCPDFIDDSSFWTGTADYETLGPYLWGYYNYSNDVNDQYNIELDNFAGVSSTTYGIKPVIIINKSDIKID